MSQVKFFRVEDFNMGLDMTISATKHINAYDESFLRSLELAELMPVGCIPKSVSVEAVYWRKANQIHGWFTANLSGSLDEDNAVIVTEDDIEELLDKINNILPNNVELAENELPPMAGFFFGTYDIDEHYFDQLSYTKEKLSALLEKKLFDKGYELQYYASW